MAGSVRNRKSRNQGNSAESNHAKAAKNKDSEPNGAREHKPKKKARRSFFSRKLIVFVIGGIVGLFGAQHFMRPQMASDIADASLQWLISHKNLLPATVLEQLEASQSSAAKLSDSFAVGLNMYEEGYRPKHPVILFPGVISTSLESWSLHGTDECPSKPHYRNSLWGGWYMIRMMLLDKGCWLKHIMLDKETGLDPPNFKVRAAEGLEAADFFITGYWIWNKIIENLSALGYDPNNMKLAAYDWRLGYPDLERRDGFFTSIKHQVEQLHHNSGEKVVLTAHSMGSQVVFYFLKWVEAMGPGFGNGGPNWVEDHVEAFVDISGSLLGTPKSLVALLSGEMKDTVQLNALAVQGLEKFFGRSERADMLRTFPGIASMLPKGGSAIWGDLDGSPDDDSNLTYTGSFGNFIRFAETDSRISARNLSMADSFDFLFSQTPKWFSDRTKSMYTFGLSKTRKEVKKNEKDPRTWSNPLEVGLPNAPSLNIYSLYGVGKPTERAYYYKDLTSDNASALNVAIDYDNRESVIMGPGDGTISLVCHTISHRWKDANSKLNPGHSPVKIVEMLHQPDDFDLRGGAQTAEHVDILGRTELNELVLRVASGHGHEIQERVISGIDKWVHDIDLGE